MRTIAVEPQKRKGTSGVSRTDKAKNVGRKRKGAGAGCIRLVPFWLLQLFDQCKHVLATLWRFTRNVLVLG